MISLRLILSSGMVDRGIVDCWRSALKPQSPQGSLRLQTSVVVVSPTPGISHFVQFQFWSWNTDEKQWLFTHYCKLQQQSVSLVKYLKRGCPTNHSLPTLLLLCYASLLLCSAAQYELLCWEDCCSYSWQNSDRPVPAIACHYYEYHCIPTSVVSQMICMLPSMNWKLIAQWLKSPLNVALWNTSLVA